MESSVKERLILYLEYKGLSKAEFGRKIGVSPAFITSMRKSIQPDKVKSIALEFPDLDTTWLMTGEGTMLKSSSPDPSPSTARADSSVSPVASSQLAILQAENARLKAENERLGNEMGFLHESLTALRNDVEWYKAIIERIGIGAYVRPMDTTLKNGNRNEVGK